MPLNLWIYQLHTRLAPGHSCTIKGVNLARTTGHTADAKLTRIWSALATATATAPAPARAASRQTCARLLQGRQRGVIVWIGIRIRNSGTDCCCLRPWLSTATATAIASAAAAPSHVLLLAVPLQLRRLATGAASQVSVCCVCVCFTFGNLLRSIPAQCQGALLHSNATSGLRASCAINPAINRTIIPHK